MLVLLLAIVSTISGMVVVMGLSSAVDTVMFLLSLLLFASLHAGFTFCKHPCFWWRPYCVGGPVVAFIPAVACFPAVVSGHDIAVILKVACCWRYCCCLCHCCCLHPDSGKHSCCSWRPLSSWWFPVAGLSAIADVPGVTNGVIGVSAVLFEHAVAGSPAVTGFSAVEGVLANASVPADPGIHILAGGFTYWIVDVLHYRLSGCIFFCCWTIGILWRRHKQHNWIERRAVEYCMYI